MKSYLTSYLVLIFLTLINFGSMKVMGQGVCVIAEQKVGRIAGTVRFMDSESFVAGAKLKLMTRTDKTKTISEAGTDERGWFEFENIAKGRYMLIASGPNLSPLYIPLKVVDTENHYKLQISLGALIGEPCGGGDVTTAKLH